MTRPLIIGSRGSDLALWQSRHVQSLLKDRTGVESAIEIIRTTGDRIDSMPFDKMEGKGFFTKELEDALLAGSIDLAVHSLKDLPTETPPGLVVAAVPERTDLRELLLIAPGAHAPGRTPLPLAHGAVVGTSAARRTAQLRALRPDLVVKPLRGNVPTRLGRLTEGAFDAILLAAAGVGRLGLDLAGVEAVVLEPETFVPAPGQGALAIEAREGDGRVLEILSHIHDEAVASVVTVERSLLGRFGGGCSLPLGACIRREGSRFRMDAFWAPSGDRPPVRVVEHGIGVVEHGIGLAELAERVYLRLTGADRAPGEPDPGRGDR